MQEPPKPSSRVAPLQATGQRASDTVQSAALALIRERLLHHLNANLEIRRHPRARRLTLRINGRRRSVVVTMPRRCPLNEAGDFIGRHYDWIKKQLDGTTAMVPLRDGAVIPLRGVSHLIRFTGNQTGTGVVRCVHDVSQYQVHVSGHEEHCPRRLRDWLKAEARRDLQKSVLRHSATISVQHKRVSVRDTSSRWGSCSATGTLSFSWRLIMAPPAILDYVAAHEVAHLRELNHGPRFWALVAKLVPDFEIAERWLRYDGAELHKYDPFPNEL